MPKSHSRRNGSSKVRRGPTPRSSSSAATPSPGAMRANRAERAAMLAPYLRNLPEHNRALYATLLLWSNRTEGQPANSCQNSCMTVSTALRDLHMASSIRAVRAQVDGVADRFVVGSDEPRWRDGLWNGHVVLHIPSLGRLADPTIHQAPPFLQAAGRNLPIVISVGPQWDEGKEFAVPTHGGVLVTYRPIAAGSGTSWYGPKLEEHRDAILLEGHDLADEVKDLLATHELYSSATKERFPKLYRQFAELQAVRSKGPLAPEFDSALGTHL